MLALIEDSSNASLDRAFQKLYSTRPTAVNLGWALKRVFEKVKLLPPDERVNAARNEADLIANEDSEMCELIGNYGLDLFLNALSKSEQNFRINN